MSKGIDTKVLLRDAAAARVGAFHRLDNTDGYTVQAIVTGSGAVSATVNLYGSHYENTARGELIGTLSPAGTDTGVDALTFDAPWPVVWAELTAIAGTGAAATVTVAG